MRSPVQSRVSLLKAFRCNLKAFFVFVDSFFYSFLCFCCFQVEPLFGQENSKELLIDLLNDLLEGERHIEDLTYMNTEMPPETSDGRTAVFDLRCKDKDGNMFIVEMQNCSQPYIYERGLYYICRVIAGQDKVGDSWNFEIVPVYGIFFLNFKSGKTDKVRTDIILADKETGEPVSKMIREIFIEFPLFNKTEKECETPLDYWLYNLKHMEKLESLQFKGQKALFQRLEELARIVNMNKKERDEYEACLKVYRDNYNTWNYMKEQAIKEGFEEGRADGLAEGIGKGRAEAKKELLHGFVKSMKEADVPLDVISQYSKLSISEIEGID